LTDMAGPRCILLPRKATSTLCNFSSSEWYTAPGCGLCQV
jgi:hypothetical protein